MNVSLQIFLVFVSGLIIYRLLVIEKRQVMFECLLNSINAKLFAEKSVDPVISKKETDKQPGANRKPRTDEQKQLASIRRKEWWAKKRASESLTQVQEAQSQTANLNG